MRHNELPDIPVLKQITRKVQPLTAPEFVTVTEDVFREMCRRHDITFAQSDDRRAYKRGRDSLLALRVAAEKLPREVAVRVFNEVVDERIRPEFAAQFYWSVK